VLLGPPGTGKTHLATALGITSRPRRLRVLFASAQRIWSRRLADAHRQGVHHASRPQDRRFGLITVLEVPAYCPFETRRPRTVLRQLVSAADEHRAHPHLQLPSAAGVASSETKPSPPHDPTRVVHHADVSTSTRAPATAYAVSRPRHLPSTRITTGRSPRPDCAYRSLFDRRK